MAKRGRPPKVGPLPELSIERDTVTTVLEEAIPAPITEKEEDFLKMVKVGVSGMTAEAQIIGAKPGYVYRQVHVGKIDINRAKGYEPVTDERLQGPYANADGTRHGDTMLMRCRKGIVDARNALREKMSTDRVKRIVEETPRGAGVVGGKVNIMGRRNG